MIFLLHNSIVKITMRNVNGLKICLISFILIFDVTWICS